MNSKVSIVIPALNEEGYIRGAVESLLKQDYPNIEIIVVDNGSTDKTVDIVKKYPTVILVQEPERGLLKAREAGRKKATGEIIAQMDADCLAPNNWVSTALTYFKDKRVAAVSGPYDFYDAPLSFYRVIMPTQKYLMQPFSEVINALLKRATLIGGNAFIRASALEAIGGYDTSIKFHGEDADTGNRLSLTGRVLFRNDIALYSSARRFVSIGIGKTMWRYSINHIWVSIFNRPFHAGVEYHDTK